MMDINPSSGIIRNQQDSLKVKAQQMVVDTERSFTRILGQLLTDREQNGALPTDITTDSESGSLNIRNLPLMLNETPIQNNRLLAGTQIHRVEYSSQNQSSKINSEKLNNILGGKLKGTGEWFISAGKQFGVDPALLAAISMHETGNGSSRAAYQRNNISGTMTSSGLKNYDSIQQSIMDMARNLRENYLNKGLRTVEEIGKKYAPIGASNDPNNLNQYWVNQVKRNIGRLST